MSFRSSKDNNSSITRPVGSNYRWGGGTLQIGGGGHT